ncbi:sigma-70 family RNA polymerase sigma factor [Nocardia alni]|uniref:sigma-70 family RNA polymerase sigma factor n=1 Tax=Nocardia alni TaxID=2815723 RepID=UPI001C22D8D1|nr:sigma-70 family RNA polymerase sigma factor [Nocardia alni]
MPPHELLAVEFEAHRPRLRSVAYRMLGSSAEAEDAVQEAWLRLARTDAGDIGNLGGWLTTVVGRVCLDMLRTRKVRREDPLDDRESELGVVQDPEQRALLADSVGLALQVVLDTLSPAERLAFVLHDLFGLPFEQIAPIVDRTPATAKKLASRARLRVRGAAPGTQLDPAAQCRVVDAFQIAARGGDFDALLAILDPDVVLRVDAADGTHIVRGAASVAGQAGRYRRGLVPVMVSHPVLVDGRVGLVNIVEGELFSVTIFAAPRGWITQIDIVTAPERLARLEPADFSGDPAPTVVTFSGAPSSQE